MQNSFFATQQMWELRPRAAGEKITCIISLRWESRDNLMEIAGQIGCQGIRMALRRKDHCVILCPDTRRGWTSVGPLNWILPSLLMVHYQGWELTLTSQAWRSYLNYCKLCKAASQDGGDSICKAHGLTHRKGWITDSCYYGNCFLTPETCILPSREVQPSPVWDKIAKQVWLSQGRGPLVPPGPTAGIWSPRLHRALP